MVNKLVQQLQHPILCGAEESGTELRAVIAGVDATTDAVRGRLQHHHPRHAVTLAHFGRGDEAADAGADDEHVDAARHYYSRNTV